MGKVIILITVDANITYDTQQRVVEVFLLRMRRVPCELFDRSTHI